MTTDRLKEIEKLFEDWNIAIQSGDPDQVVALYANNGVLIPTLSDDTRVNHEEMRDYFEEFLKNKPKAKIVESNVRVYGDIGINSGLYAFVFRSGKSPILARYTYVYIWSGTNWLIAEHHSSLLYKDCSSTNKMAENFYVASAKPRQSTKSK